MLTESAESAPGRIEIVLDGGKRVRVEPFAYVRDLLVQLSGDPPNDLSVMLPDAWSQQHPEARRSWSR